jgi:uncharacterized membrane protein YfcA
VLDSLDWLPAAVGAAAVFVAYGIFAIAAFGTALVAAPVLAQVMPVAKVVPLLSLLDLIAAVSSLVRLRGNVSRPELMRLLPGLVVGAIAGASLLLVLPARSMMFALGVFVALYGLRGLFFPREPGTLSPRWALPFGLAGGLLGGMFGTGGFIYAMYLSRRLDAEAMRATQSILISLSSSIRVTIFAIAGVYADSALLLLFALLLPAMLLGLYAGNHVRLRLSRAQFLRVLHALLAGSGLALAWRALS